MFFKDGVDKMFKKKTKNMKSESLRTWAEYMKGGETRAKTLSDFCKKVKSLLKKLDSEKDTTKKNNILEQIKWLYTNCVGEQLDGTFNSEIGALYNYFPTILKPYSNRFINKTEGITSMEKFIESLKVQE